MAEMTRAEAAELLGLPENADKAAVNAAVRKLTTKYHPDAVRNKSPEEQAEAERMFKAVNKAKKVMLEPPKPQEAPGYPPSSQSYGTQTFAGAAAGRGGSAQRYQQGRVPNASTNARVNNPRAGMFEESRNQHRRNQYNTATAFNINTPHIVDDEEYTLQDMYTAEAQKRYKRRGDILKLTPSVISSVVFLIYAIYKVAMGMAGSMSTGISFDPVPYLILALACVAKFFIYDLLLSHHLMKALSKIMSKPTVLGFEFLFMGCAAIAISLPKSDIVAVALAFLGIALVGTGFIVKMVSKARRKREEEEIPEM